MPTVFAVGIFVCYFTFNSYIRNGVYFLCEKINWYAQESPKGAVHKAHLSKKIKGHTAVIPHIHMKNKVYKAPNRKFKCCY